MRRAGWLRLLIAALILGVAAEMTMADDTKKSPLVGPIVTLWPQGAPGAIGEEAGDRPSLFVYRALENRSNGAAVVVCPGGGYGSLAVGHEGHEVAQWLNLHGVSAFVLRYRIAPRYHHPAPLQDVQRAIRTVRSRAAEWKVDPARIGVWGFSAGGHLASTALTHFDEGSAEAADPVDRASCRPDFGILVYPVICFGKPYTSPISMKNLLGDQVNDATVRDDLSTEKRVTSRTPPCFLIHAGGDTSVPAENSIDFYLALRKAGVPAELHLYEQGGHGFGLGGDDPVLSTWPDRLAAWMKLRGLLTKK
jgi:acetyl esterase/lipase